jgi:hypothetical protein
MSTNITTAYLKDSGIIIAAPSVTANPGSLAASMVNRIVAIHATAVTVAGTFDIGDVNGSKIKFDVGVSGSADIYIGEMGIKCQGDVSVAMPGDTASVTLILG